MHTSGQMEIRELKSQEDFDRILRATLQKGWKDQYGDPFSITDDKSRDGQRWMVQPMLSAFFTEKVSRDGRRFMMDRFRYSPIRHRMAPQWVLGTALGSSPGLRYAGRTGFWVSPSVPAARDTVVIPGSRRIRIFEFRRQITRSLVKRGFSSLSAQREIDVRSGEANGPFVRITKFDPGFDWFEEPIIPGFVLPRCPPWMDRSGLAARAISLLREWVARGVREVDAGEHAEGLVSVIGDARQGLAARFESFTERLQLGSLSRLQELASGLGRTETATVHGDFQPGNILIEHPGGKVFITDWEHSTTRFRYYDALTYILRARYGRDLDNRIGRFVSAGKGAGVLSFFPSLPDKPWRVAATALFLLEELERATLDISLAPYSSPPLGFRTLCDELPAVIDHLDHQYP